MVDHDSQSPMTPGSDGEFTLSQDFLQIAACPACHSSFAVDYDTQELICTSATCGLAFPVRDGIPILLIDEARKPAEA